MIRKMATIRRVDGIHPIEGADAIECAVIDGWTVVVKKGEFKPGELAVYCEIDSWVPTEIAPFLTKGKEPREFNCVKGERLKTVRLRGQLSQGLLLPRQVALDKVGEIHEGDDVSEVLGIQKWEAPIPAQLAGQVRGNFPTMIPKTDQERVQNLIKEISAAAKAGLKFEITEKLEGSSMTCYLINGEFGVCSRNLDLKRDENNTFWAVAIAEQIEEKMRDAFGDRNIAIQGELIGPGIQGNIYNLARHEFRVFDIYDANTGVYWVPAHRQAIVDVMGLKHVPVLAQTLLFTDVQAILATAEGKSQLNAQQEREGIVFKDVNGGMSFKAISNRYLIKQG
jgi:RNA ligase (TIGR02306 family)